MATYTIIKKTTTEEEVVMELPYCSKNNCYAFKVLDSEKSIQVGYLGINIGIQESYASFAFNHGAEQCTEEEFNQLFTKTLNKLKFLNS